MRQRGVEGQRILAWTWQHDRLKSTGAICMWLERLQQWRPEDAGVRFPCSICHFVNRKKNSKNHAADELLKVQLAQVSHKVADAQDECLFTGKTNPKRFTRTRGSVEKLNMQWNVARLWVSWRCHEVVIPEWHCIFLVTRWISYRVLILQLQVTWKDGKGFNNACVPLSLNPTYKLFSSYDDTGQLDLLIALNFQRNRICNWRVFNLMADLLSA